ncbi:MAG: hypothetical protein ACK58N_20390 [Synechocystis sp.]
MVRSNTYQEYSSRASLKLQVHRLTDLWRSPPLKLVLQQLPTT